MSLNDRTVKVDTYLKSPTFSASNGKCYNSFSSIWIFECILKVWVIKRTQKLHENSGDIFEKPEVWIVCVECNKLDSLLDCRLGKKQNRQLGCHGWTVDDFDVCIKILVPKLHSNVPLCYPFSRTSKFHEWLRIKFAKCHMVVIALELYTRPWWDHQDEVVCDKEVLRRDYLDWTWSSCQLLVGFMDLKSSEL